MKYNHFKEEDFAEDPYFQQWVQYPDGENRLFWEQFLRENPDKEREIQGAKKLVMLLSGEITADTDTNALWDDIVKDIKEGHNDKKPPKENYGWPLRWAVGFAVAAGLAIGVYTYTGQHEPTRDTPPQITLQLEDGTLHVIDNDATGTITTKDGKTVGQQDKHILVYNNRVSNATTGPAYNKLSVPYGRQFELVLSDSSHVYLNAGSTLRYPRQFLPGKPREVYLDGEAFFEVTRDTTRTFTVATRDMNTVVYGTRFNVTSYHNEASPYTVLVDGSVGVYRSGAEDIRKITPGQMATLDKDSMTIAAVNVHKYTAWTGGELYFMDDPFALILRKLERHYNVTIKNTYIALDTEQFTSSFEKGASLNVVLDVFKEFKPFGYKIEEKTITIMPPPEKQADL